MLVNTIQISDYTPETFKTTLREILREELDKRSKDQNHRPQEELMTRREVADHFKVDISTIHNWTRKGKLRAKGIGHRVYYLRSEVEQALITL